MFLFIRRMPAAAVLAASCLCLACFGGKPGEITLTSDAVGPVTTQTPFDREELEGLLKGYETANGGEVPGTTIRSIRIMNEGQEVMELFPTPDGARVGRIIVRSPDVVDDSGVNVGSVFSAVFPDPSAVSTSAGVGTYSGHVLCSSPGLPNVTYVFHGTWTGPDGVVPPRNVLDTWTVKEIVWGS